MRCCANTCALLGLVETRTPRRPDKGCCACPEIRCTDEHTEVCFKCGAEQWPIRLEQINISYEQSMGVCRSQNVVYSRTKRFETMLDQVVMGSSCQSDSKMVEHLRRLKRFRTVSDLMAAMKTSRLRDKRYCSLHFFAKCFVEGYKMPPSVSDWLHVRRQVVSAFSDFERAFNKNNQKTFVSYSWILQKLLRLFGLERFVPYVKGLKCRRRCRKYENQFHRILNQSMTSGMPSAVLDGVPASGRCGDVRPGHRGGRPCLRLGSLRRRGPP